MTNAHINDAQATPPRRAPKNVRPRGPFANFAAALSKYATISGRATRTEYASFTIIGKLLILALSGGGFALIALGKISALAPTFVGALASILALVAFLAAVGFALFYLVAGVSLTARRLHDLNCSASVLLLIFVFSFLVGISGASDENPIATLGFLLLEALLLFAPGTRGPNRYGFDPRLTPETQDASVFSSRADGSQASFNPYLPLFPEETAPVDDSTSNDELRGDANDETDLAPPSNVPLDKKR